MLLTEIKTKYDVDDFGFDKNNPEEMKAFNWLTKVAKISVRGLLHCYVENGEVCNDTSDIIKFDKKFDRLEVKFGKVRGSFDVWGSKISTFENFPYSASDLNISDCRNLTSFKGIHERIKYVYNITMYDTPIKSHLIDVMKIGGLGHITYSSNSKGKDAKRLFEAITIVNKHLGTGNKGILAAQDELMDSNLDEFA